MPDQPLITSSLSEERQRPMHIGIDVGGTNTDAVLMDGVRVVAEVKTSTTPDVTNGIVAALVELISSSGLSPSAVQAVMIGTTHFTNAIVEGKRLIPTAAIRLGIPASESLPPMVDWPARLRPLLGGHVYMCHGGHEYDGRPISAFDPEEVRRAGGDIAAKGIRTVAITSVFSPVNAELELEAARIVLEEAPDVAISLSHEIGRIGLLERENATIMNACLHDLAQKTVAAFRDALDRAGIDAPVYLSQNDGTLMTVDFGERYPVATFASGPTNSMRGAAFLSGEENCAVVDVGGTTSDIGVLQHAFPREAAVAIEIAGVRTNFRMPDVLSIGLGGGSLVRTLGGLTIGPESVGYELESQAIVFGGPMVTATDLAVAGGLAEIGDPKLAGRLDTGLVRDGLQLIETTIAEAVDRMKTSADPIPIVVVGGGSVLLGETLPGASRLVRPDHYAVANAIGAAIAQVGGEVEKVYSLERQSRDDALDDAKNEAVAKAEAAGARPSTIKIVDVEEVGLAYLPGNAVRIKVKAVGDLELEREPVASHR